MSLMRDRQKCLARILSLGLAHEGESPFLFGGCYIAGTGTSADNQAFVAGVFSRLPENQDFVSWTTEAFIEEARLERTTKLGYLFLALYTVVLVGGAIWYFIPPRK
jgi:hypothetical protein